MNLSELEIFLDRELLNNTDKNRQNILLDLKINKLAHMVAYGGCKTFEY